MKLAVVDSGVANLASVMAALHRLEVAAEITSNPEKISSAQRVIIPGVGAASAAMAQFEAKQLVKVIRNLTQPVLGICLGMQLMFEHSTEGQGVKCLGVIPAKIKQLPTKPEMPIPHMGWNQIKACQSGHALLRGIADESFVYFVHSFAAELGAYTVARCTYSEDFSAIVAHKNFFGCQFHPERSGDVGRQILKNFLEI